MSKTPEWLDYLEHTADEGIRVTAPTEALVFERAAWGMFSLLSDLSSVEDRDSMSISVSAEDSLSLLIAWLSELNVRHQTERILLSRFVVDELADTALRARAWGEPYNPDRHELLTEIKAVTYCEAKLEQEDDHWLGQVVFDV